MPATLCSGITVGAINVNCDDNGQGLITGAAETMMIYNFADIDLRVGGADVTYDVTLTNLITAITNPSGIAAFSFKGFRRTHKPLYEFVPGNVSVGYNHSINFHVLESTVEQKENLMRMNSGRVIVVVENVHNITNNAFEVYGVDVGLQVLTDLRDIDDVENGAGFQINLITNEADTKEPLMPRSFFITDFATTKALFDALTTPGI